MVFVAYLAGATASALAFSSTVSAFFAPGGITVAALLLTRRRLWPVIVGALVAAELLVDRVSGLSWAISGGFALGNAAEAVVGAALVRTWCGGIPDLRRTRDLSLYVLGAAGVGALCGALIGGATKWWAFGVPPIQGMTQWFAGDAIAVLVVGTSILLWTKQSYILRSRPLETASILAGAAVLSVVGFMTDIPPGTTVLPILAIAAVRLGVLGTALTGVVVAAISNYLTGWHYGLLGKADTSDPLRVAMAQLFVIVLVLTAMVIAQEVSKRTSAVQERDVERGQRLRLESLSELAQQLAAALTPVDVGAALERSLPRELGATSLSLGLLGEDSGRLEWVAGREDFPRTAADAAVRTAKPVVVDPADDDGCGYGAWPLFSGEKVIGVLLVGLSQPNPIDAEQLSYGSAVAALVGESLVRAQTYADEHARAAVLHSALHPASQLPPAGIEFGVCYEPADAVRGLGGDWYDVLPLPKNRTYFAVGDIVGHGLQAVEDMAALRSAARTLAHRGESPAEVLADLNDFTEDVVRSEFATMVVAVFDHTAGVLTYSSAGHPPAFVRKAETGRVLQLSEANGPLLGPLRAASYEDGVIRLDSGDVLVMYTDGLVERPGLAVSAGISRAEQVIAQLPEAALLDCEALVETLVPPPRSDDICVLAVRFD